MHILRIELFFFQLKTVCTCDSVASKYLKVYSRLFDTRIIIQLNNDELPLNPTKKNYVMYYLEGLLVSPSFYSKKMYTILNFGMYTSRKFSFLKFVLISLYTQILVSCLRILKSITTCWDTSIMKVMTIQLRYLKKEKATFEFIRFVLKRQIIYCDDRRVTCRYT